MIVHNSLTCTDKACALIVTTTYSWYIDIWFSDVWPAFFGNNYIFVILKNSNAHNICNFLWTLERLSLNMLNTYLKNTHFYHRLSWDIRILPVYSSVKVSHSLRRRLDPHLLSNLSLSQMLRNKLKGINKETYIYLLSISFYLI